MAVPIAVVKPLTASANASLSLVGRTTISASPVKATMPICVPCGWSSMKASAACWATARRFGSTSVEHMLRETSIAKMIVVRFMGTVSSRAGRAMPRSNPASPETNRAKGRCRRQRVYLGMAARTRARLEKRTA